MAAERVHRLLREVCADSDHLHITIRVLADGIQPLIEENHALRRENEALRRSSQALTARTRTQRPIRRRGERGGRGGISRGGGRGRGGMRALAEIASRAIEPRQTEPAPVIQQEPEVPRCFSCDSTSHMLSECIRAPRGTIQGCPLCGAYHPMETCSEFPVTKIEQLFAALVASRSCMPAWQTVTPWYRHLKQWMGSDQARGMSREEILNIGMPWSEEFAREMASSNSIDTLQKQVEESVWPELPNDPATLNLEVVCETYGLSIDELWAIHSAPPAPPTPPFKREGSGSPGTGFRGVGISSDMEDD
ncbi:hypothetical protein FALBO_10664 [Fusarium albosuccineum]|uniref:Uncharacterized protein n=1 Tax=Fusarium albosuccineum TaxID=1237068 RepID=A0A8H4L5L0_9HYPO|nr:hypothetical protein FALBO_10664 [Fusarium albosuccineum]